MIKILITDDSPKRPKAIIDAVSKTEFCNLVQITTCVSADKARIELLDTIDILVLDILLPKKDNGTPHSSHSINLLKDICDPTKRYIRPKTIIGLTADISGLTSYQDEFIKYATSVLSGSADSSSWLTTLLTTIESYVDGERKAQSRLKDSLLITVHGIRTYGKWQDDLKSAVNSYSRSFDYIDLKYGFFDLISFTIPSLRERKARRISSRLKDIIESNQNKEIHIICHSFGSIILSKAMHKYSGKRIKNIILCGSPIPHSKNIDHIVAKAELTINECGTRDIILVLARTFLLGLGDAGRVGFTREHSSSFINRYFVGGHSLYFENMINPFWIKHWIPILTVNSAPEKIDQRENYFGEDLAELIISSFTIFKPLLYISLSTIIIWWAFSVF
ncbi:hypothetical protein C1896_17185 [Pseudomonadaceae bacterium SI-3]|nr:hypothetical protein C1896_17185 [Pseudomonadaceae bacterium SI-3]